MHLVRAIVECQLEVFGVPHKEIGYPNSVEDPEDEALKSSFSASCAETLRGNLWRGSLAVRFMTFGERHDADCRANHQFSPRQSGQEYLVSAALEKEQS